MCIFGLYKNIVSAFQRLKCQEWQVEFYVKLDHDYYGYITIFGHTLTRSIRAAFSQKRSDDIWVCDKYHDKIGIDGAIAFGGQLNCINLDTMEVVKLRPQLQLRRSIILFQ